MTVEARRAAEKLGFNTDELFEISPDLIREHAKGEKLTDDVVEMRMLHHELRRRKKLKLVCETLKTMKAGLSGTLGQRVNSNANA